MDFFQHQEKAKSRTFLLVFLYSLGLAGLALAVAAVTFSFVPDPTMLVCCIGGVLAIVVIASLVKTAQLSAGGGRAVAESLGGRQVSPSSTNPADRRLYNVVEEMALAAGVPVPTLYVMDNEQSINAFAAGFSPNTAVIGVNRGTIELLTRD
jgi:Zn-dependent protease with chaperone function